MALLQSFLVLILACSVSEVGGIENVCLSSQLPSLDNSILQIGGNRQIILPTMNFSSCGVIQSWVVRADGRAAGNALKTITLQLFKPDNMAASVFTQISSTVVETAISNAVTTAYTFSDVGLQFSPGFVLGMKLPNTKFVGLHQTSYSTHFYAERFDPGDPAVVTVAISHMTLFPVMSVSVMCSECPTTPAPMPTASSPDQMPTQTPVSSVNVDGSSSERTSQDEASSIASSPTPTASVSPSPVSSSLSSSLTTSSSSSFPNSALSSISSPSIPPISTSTSVIASPKTTDQAVTTESTSEPDGTPEPSSIVMVCIPLGSTSGPVVAIGVCIAAVLVLVLVVVFVIVLVAVCITRKNRKNKLSNSPMYDTPPDAYCTFGSERAMVPQNGHELIAMSSSYAEVESVPSAFVISNNSAAVYKTPTAQPEKHSATGSLDAQYTSLNEPEVPQLYTQLNTATNPEKSTHSATDCLDVQYTSLKAPDVPQLYTQLNTATKPGEYIYCSSGDLVEDAYVPIYDESHSNLIVATTGSRKAEDSYRVGEHQYANVQSTQTGADQQTVSVRNKQLDKHNVPIPSEVYEEVGIPNDHDMESTADSEYI